MNYTVVWYASVFLLTFAAALGVAKSKLESLVANVKLVWEKFDALREEVVSFREEFIEVRTQVRDLVLRVDAHNSANVVNAVQGFTEMMKENLDKLDERLEHLDGQR